jgi:hypothetical protein
MDAPRVLSALALVLTASVFGCPGPSPETIMMPSGMGMQGTPCAGTAVDCPATGTACIVPTCVNQICSAELAPARTPCTEVPHGLCDGQGSCGSCVDDTDCTVTGETCTGGACVQGLAADGTACTSGTTCLNGNCADGVCCNVACTESCMSCTMALTGVPDGTCAATPMGPDPKNLCVLGCDGSTGCVAGKAVFVTSGTWEGNFMGAAGADPLCATAAMNLPPATWAAWTSDDMHSPATDRFMPSAVPYKLLDGTPVADSFSALTGGTLSNAIDLDETKTLTSGVMVWTGTTTGGTEMQGGTCNDWSGVVGSALGEYGKSDGTGVTWTQAEQETCDTPMHLYCFQQ